MGWTNTIFLGFIPEILRDDDPRPVKDQMNERYEHGGGFHAFPNKKRFTINDTAAEPCKLVYHEDDFVETMEEWGRCWFPITEELVIVFDSAITAIIQKDGSFELTRMD